MQSSRYGAHLFLVRVGNASRSPEKAMATIEYETKVHIFIPRNGIWGTWCLACTVWNEIIKLMAVRHVGAHVFMCTTFLLFFFGTWHSVAAAINVHACLAKCDWLLRSWLRVFFFVVLLLLYFIIIIIALDENDRHIFTTCSTVDNVLRTISTQKQNEWVG